MSNLKLKKLSEQDENLYLHRNDTPLACPYAAGGSVTQMVYPEKQLTIGGQQQLPISDQQPRRVTCGTWCALFDMDDGKLTKVCVQRCGTGPQIHAKVEL